MVRSMTGFGEASEQVEGVFYSVELRSLNNRFFKATIRLPELIAALEAELEAQLRRRLRRGSVTLTVTMHDAGAVAAHRINEAALSVYLKYLENLYRRFSQSGQASTIDLTALLALPGVLESADESEILRKARPVVTRLVDQAADKLLAMRAVEGQALAAELLRQRDVIASKLQSIRQRAPVVVEEYHQRLRQRVNELLRRAELAVNQVDLIREIAVFAERSDINEEISRLATHLEQMQQLLERGSHEPIGRTLEFLAQEMLREANTLASKSNDALISRDVVEVKSAIDRIKEQAANIE